MFIKNIKNCEEFVAGDETILKEILHPDPKKDNLKIRYSIAHAIVKPGKITLLHRMRTSEVYYILHGSGLMCVDDETEEVESGHAIYIPPNATQRIRNTGDKDLIFLCIVDPAWRKEDEEVLE
jgi:mannose-6-phosphate isomerase-like protein (cupin superfamily)